MSHYFRFMKFNKGLTVASNVFWATFEPPYPSSGSIFENLKRCFYVFGCEMIVIFWPLITITIFGSRNTISIIDYDVISYCAIPLKLLLLHNFDWKNPLNVSFSLLLAPYSLVGSKNTANIEDYDVISYCAIPLKLLLVHNFDWKKPLNTSFSLFSVPYSPTQIETY